MLILKIFKQTRFIKKMKRLIFTILLPCCFGFQNIILIGMPDTGKTYLGRHLGQFLKIPFYDSDEHNLLMHEEKNNTKSWNLFRKKESELIQNWMKDSHPKIISTGGGCIEDHVLYHQFINRSPQNIIIHVMRDYKLKTKKNLPKSKEELWIKRGKWYFLIADYTYWNIHDSATFLDWFQENFKK